MAQIKIIDALDRKILRALQRDSDEPIADLAAGLGLSRSACSRRIARLAEIGVIERSVALLSQSKLGLGLTVFIAIKTNQHNAVKINLKLSLEVTICSWHIHTLLMIA